MKVIEPGHIYELEQLDGDGKPLRLVFVNREKNQPENTSPVGVPHEGTQIQEVIRMQIDILHCLCDRVNHCDSCLRWEGNDHILKHFTEIQRRFRLALLLFEARGLERKVEKDDLNVEALPTGIDGHLTLPKDGLSWEEKKSFWADMNQKKKG